MVGLIAKKVGSTVLFSDDGTAEHVTLLSVEDCVVVQHKTVEKDGYNALVIGAFKTRAKLVAKPQLGVFAKSGIEPRRIMREFRVNDFSEDTKVGAVLTTSVFSKGQLICAVGKTKGKGFAGVMKRHNFRGLEATHGVSISHRSHGSIGQRTYPSKVFKGKKMAGRMGGVRVTLKNLKVVYLEDGVVGVKGAVPGAIGGYILLYVR